jgi:hypothetical protein
MQGRCGERWRKEVGLALERGSPLLFCLLPPADFRLLTSEK